MRQFATHVPSQRGTDQLERLADNLLETSGALKRGRFIFTSVALERKIRIDRNRSAVVDDCAVPDEVVGYLVEKQIDELVDVSNLTLRQEIVFRLCAGGLSTREIAATLGIKHQNAALRLRSARRKIRAARRQGIYAGWYEVYLSEVRRGSK